MIKIVAIQMGLVAKRMGDRHIKLTWSDEVGSYLAKKGYDPDFGARPLKRLIQHEVVNMLSKAILGGEIKSNKDVHLILKEGSICF